VGCPLSGRCPAGWPRPAWVLAARSSILAVFLAGLGAAAGADDAYDTGRKLFIEAASPPCALCHALAEAGAEGAIGPVLDELKPDPQRVVQALRNGIGQMPSYQASLSEADIQALATYVSKATAIAR
jgi:cytochrome c6